MNINVRYEAQVRRAAGVAAASVDVNDDATILQLVQHLAGGAQEPLRRVLVDDAGAVRSTVMVFLNEEYLPLTSTRRLDAGGVVTITSPISGG